VHVMLFPQADLLLKISELEGHSIKAKLEKMAVIEDRDKLYQRFREFRDKYVATPRTVYTGRGCDKFRPCCVAGTTNLSEAKQICKPR